ncbi:MAG: class I SAM-dependent methyltransferase [Nannocystaceae bacterium]|nr:class I SAM-dependent methyltransferase [bacterium]
MWAEPNDDVIPHLDCPMCHNQDRRFLVGTWEDPIGVARCTACGLVHTTGRHAEAVPLPPAHPIDGMRRRAIRQAFERYDRMLGGRLRTPAPGASTLDVGSDEGWLDLMKLWGYDAEGTSTEPTPAALGHRVHDVDPTQCGVDLGRQYDVITLIDQLDLLERPVAALHFAARHLAPGGVVIVEVPNWNHRKPGAVLPDGVELGHQVAFYDRDSLREALLAVGLHSLATWSAPQALDRAISTTKQLVQRRQDGWMNRTLRLAERALSHASDASDQGAKLVIVAHRPIEDVH